MSKNTAATVAGENHVTDTKLMNIALTISLTATPSPGVVHMSQIISLCIKTLCLFALQSTCLKGTYSK